MKALLLFALIHATYATLVIKGPTGPILEGQTVNLECQYVDTNASISRVIFQKFYQYNRYDYDDYGSSRYRNRYRYRYNSRYNSRYSQNSDLDGYWDYSSGWLNRTEDSVVLSFLQIQKKNAGSYRCTANSYSAAPDNASLPFTIKVEYMNNVMINRELHFTYRTAPNVVKVQRGDNLVLNCNVSASETPTYFWYKQGNDWMLPSAKLTVENVNEMDEGQYTCMAEHPTVKSLSKNRTISIVLLPEEAAWYDTSNGYVLLTTAAAAGALLLFIISMSVFMCRRSKEATSSKGPIDDRSQKKPIYKTSVESLPSVSTDNQPLV
ncbi:uncharacterized protein KZ484_026458 [Pholidichthys leucotaenia]